MVFPIKREDSKEALSGKIAPPRMELTRFSLTILTFGLVIFFFLPQSATRALWTDDLFSLTTAEENLPKMLRLLGKYKPGYFDHPPLYFILLHFVLYFGNSPLILRSISLICMALSIALWSIEIERRVKGFLLAAGFTFLLTIHPEISYQATTVRMYALFSFLTTLSSLLILRLPNATKKESKFTLIYLALLLALTMYTSYFGFFYFIGVISIGLLWTLFPSAVWGYQRRVGLVILLSCLLSALFLIPWSPTFFRLLKAEGEGEVYPSSRFNQFLSIVINSCGTKIGLISFFVGWLSLFLFSKQKKEWTIMFVGLCIIPLILLTLLLPLTRLLQLWYLIFAIPIITAGAIIGWSSLAERVFRAKELIIVCVISLALLVSTFNYLRLNSSYFKPTPDWWAAAKIIERNAKPYEIILTGGYLSGEAIVYHLKNPHNFSFIHYLTELDSFYLYCKDPKVVWYVNAAPLPTAYEKILKRYFPYRIQFEGNNGLGPIQVFAKKQFILPWGGISPYSKPEA